jgi:cysteine desulfurase/selenocysteine lyase
MAQMAKNVGAIVVVDAAQSIPHRRLNVNRLNIDFLAFSSHKMLGPTGIGVLYGRQQHLEKLTPTYVGGGMVDWVDTTSYRTRKIPHKFEAGTPHIAGVYGLVAAIKYLEKTGFERVEAHDLALGRLLLGEALKREYLEVIAPGNESTERCAIVSIKMKQQANLGDIARMLSDSYGIMCRTGHMCAQPLVDYLANGEILRASGYLYNTKQDINAFFQALDEIQSAI